MPSETKVYRADIDEDGLLTFPPELIEDLGWQEGDELRWVLSDTDSCVILVNLTAEIRKFAHNPDNYPGEVNGPSNTQLNQGEVGPENGG